MREDTPPRNAEDDIDDGSNSDHGEIIEIIDINPNEETAVNENEPETATETFDAIYEVEDEEEPIVDDAKYTFLEHMAPVFSCDIHATQNLAVTGGEDDCAYVWDINSTEIIEKLTNHTDTVIASNFSHDGKYLATGDMAGNIYVYKLNELHANQLLTLVYEHKIGDMTWLHWHLSTNIIFAGCSSGEIYMIRIPSGECKIMPGHNCIAQVGKLTHDGTKLFAGYADGTLKLWDLKSCKALHTINQQTQPTLTDISALDCSRQSPLYAAGDANGNIVFCTHNGYATHLKVHGQVECLAFNPHSTELQLCVSGTLNGQIAVFDCVRFCLRTLCQQSETPSSITNIKFLNEHVFHVATTTGFIYAYDERSGAVLYKLSGHRNAIYEFSYNTEKTCLLSVSKDCTARIFSLPVQ